MTLGSHQRTVGKSQVHLTPKWILDRLGPFDLDPCAANPRPWDCASENYSLPLDGLALPWRGRVFLNPPFDRYQVGKWIAKLADHGNGIALVHARTEAEWFEPIWEKAAAILFLASRITFCQPDGSPSGVINKTTGRFQPANSGAPAVLAAFGEQNIPALWSIPGTIVTAWLTTPSPQGIANPDSRKPRRLGGKDAGAANRGAEANATGTGRHDAAAGTL